VPERGRCRPRRSSLPSRRPALRRSRGSRSKSTTRRWGSITEPGDERERGVGVRFAKLGKVERDAPNYAAPERIVTAEKAR
jgi:hypothetical protein